MVRRCTCVLLREFQARHRQASLDNPAMVTCLSNLSACTPQEVGCTISHMVDVGSRYKNLEKSLGVGVALVVGCQIADSTYVSSATTHSLL